MTRSRIFVRRSVGGDLFRVQAINSATQSSLKSHHHRNTHNSIPAPYPQPSFSLSLSLFPKWLSRPSMSPTSLPSTSSRRMPLSPSAPPASPTVHLFFHRKMLVVVSLLAEIFEPRPLFPLLLPFCNEFIY